MAVVVLAITGAQKYRDVAKKLRKAGPQGKELRKELNKAIRGAGKDAVADTRRAITNLPVKGTRGGGGQERTAYASRNVKTDRGRASAARRSGLRRTIAGATGIRIKPAGITISVDGGKLPPNQRSLPRALDSRKGWRHPLFGDTSRWYGQRGGPWFFKTLYGHSDKFRKAIDQALDDIAKKIDG